MRLWMDWNIWKVCARRWIGTVWIDRRFAAVARQFSTVIHMPHFELTIACENKSMDLNWCESTKNKPYLSTKKLSGEMWSKLIIVSNLGGLKNESAFSRCHPYRVELCLWIIIDDLLLNTIGPTMSVPVWAMGHMFVT